MRCQVRLTTHHIAGIKLGHPLSSPKYSLPISPPIWWGRPGDGWVKLALERTIEHDSAGP